jgi:hypothetical protein
MLFLNDYLSNLSWILYVRQKVQITLAITLSRSTKTNNSSPGITIWNIVMKDIIERIPYCHCPKKGKSPKRHHFYIDFSSHKK